MGRYADDLAPDWRAIVHLNAMSDSVALWEQRIRHGLVYDSHVRRSHRIVLGERSADNYRKLHRREEIGTDGNEANLCGWACYAFDTNAGIVRSSQRKLLVRAAEESPGSSRIVWRRPR